MTPGTETALEPGDDHDITPQLGTCYTLSGLEADLLRRSDYPVRAVCQRCGKPVQTDSFSGEWYHSTWDVWDGTLGPEPEMHRPETSR